MSNNALQIALQRGTAIRRDGTSHSLAASVHPDFADALRRLSQARQFRDVLEIGFANGITTLAVLTGSPSAHVISLDPVQTEQYGDAGTVTLEQAGVAGRHTLIQEPDYLALPEMLREGRRFDLTYIDGWHTFDYVLLDAFYADRMTPVGGVIGFNDCGWPAVHRVIRYLTSHRRYDEIDVGLGRYIEAPPWKQAARRVLRRRPNVDRYFVKREDWEPSWNFYTAF